ncbi:hypothetical protein ACFZAM_37045 [Streptomyces sp. NPDC008079]|uniref:hypothetical protein n=1 Tax=unclassified Streptomyces TaxID=2593676 RepID=UPI0036F046CC
MVTFTQCEQEAAEIVRERLRDGELRNWIESASSTWDIEHAVFLQRVKTVIAIGLFNSHHTAEAAEEPVPHPAQTALDALREADAVGLFGVLPADLGQSADVVKWLQLLSTGLTARSAIMWERLIQSARIILDVQLVLPQEGQPLPTADDPPLPSAG